MPESTTSEHPAPYPFRSRWAPVIREAERLEMPLAHYMRENGYTHQQWETARQAMKRMRQAARGYLYSGKKRPPKREQSEKSENSLDGWT